MRSGSVGREEVVAMLERQGQTWGWPSAWGQRIPLGSVDQLSNPLVVATLLYRGLARLPQDAQPQFQPPTEAERTETEATEAIKVNGKGLV